MNVENGTRRRIVRGKSDAELRRGGFFVGRETITREECDAELARRKAAREYSAQQKARGES
jgi:hypothetical protein